jgi:hypothetical protein
MKHFSLASIVRYPALLCIVAFVIYIFNGDEKKIWGDFSCKKLFFASILLLVGSLLYVNIRAIIFTIKILLKRHDYWAIIFQVGIMGFILLIGGFFSKYLVTTILTH